MSPTSLNIFPVIWWWFYEPNCGEYTIFFRRHVCCLLNYCNEAIAWCHCGRGTLLTHNSWKQKWSQKERALRMVECKKKHWLMTKLFNCLAWHSFLRLTMSATTLKCMSYLLYNVTVVTANGTSNVDARVHISKKCLDCLVFCCCFFVVESEWSRRCL